MNKNPVWQMHQDTTNNVSYNETSATYYTNRNKTFSERINKYSKQT